MKVKGSSGVIGDGNKVCIFSSNVFRARKELEIGYRVAVNTTTEQF